MEEEHNFVSCIKINGVPILPPLITPDRKNELLKYKEKAVLLEQAYQLKKQHSHNGVKHTKILNSEISIIIPRNNQPIPSKDLTYVPYGNQQKDKINKSLTLENSDNSKANSLEVSSITISSTDKSALNSVVPVTLSCDSKNEISHNDMESEKEESSMPRLIRSNSYTLDTPSTILLDHMRRQTASCCEPSAPFVKSDPSSSRVELVNDSGRSRMNSVTSEDQKDPNSHISYEERNINKNVNIGNQPSLEVITTDITVQQINFTTTDSDIEQSSSYNDIISTSLGDSEPSPLTDPEIELQAVLKKIPEDYAQKIMQLIEEQKKEQLNRTHNYEFIKSQMLQAGNYNENVHTEITSPKRILVTSASHSLSNRPLSVSANTVSSRSEYMESYYSTTQKSAASSLNESQTLPIDLSTSSTESLDNFSLRTFRILNLDDEANNDFRKNPSFSERIILAENNMKRKEEMDYEKQSDIQKLREEKAACIIGAYVKGYLVRRLMNTAKVKTIIQTIQDALMCALELQTSETIEEADVELHRKLIKLVSSACFEFHDIFFALSVPEQMDIIAMDREKIKKTVAVRSTVSSTDVRQISPGSNIRFFKSLTQI